MNLVIFPWQDPKKEPYWINPENGYEWWIDQGITDWCSRRFNDNPPLEAVCFYVVEVKTDGERNPLIRVLMDSKTNRVLKEHTSVESLCYWIDILRFANNKNIGNE